MIFSKRLRLLPLAPLPVFNSLYEIPYMLTG